MRRVSRCLHPSVASTRRCSSESSCLLCSQSHLARCASQRARATRLESASAWLSRGVAQHVQSAVDIAIGASRGGLGPIGGRRRKSSSGKLSASGRNRQALSARTALGNWFPETCSRSARRRQALSARLWAFCRVFGQAGAGGRKTSEESGTVSHLGLLPSFKMIGVSVLAGWVERPRLWHVVRVRVIARPGYSLSALFASRLWCHFSACPAERGGVGDAPPSTGPRPPPRPAAPAGASAALPAARPPMRRSAQRARLPGAGLPRDARCRARGLPPRAGQAAGRQARRRGGMSSEPASIVPPP
eukprot:scaffold126065_cov63-Phaeocystis_antarctica.AAC.3